MEHVVGLVRAEDVLHVALAADASHDSLGLNVRKFLTHHEADVVLRGLSLIDEYEFRWVVSSNLRH